MVNLQDASGSMINLREASKRMVNLRRAPESNILTFSEEEKEKPIQISQASEIAKTQMKNLENQEGVVEVHALNKHKSKPQEKQGGAKHKNSCQSEYKKLVNKPEIKPTKMTIRSYTGEKIPITGVCHTTFICSGKKDEVFFVIVPQECQAILGLETCENFKLITRVNTVIKDSTMGDNNNSDNSTFKDEIMKEFADVFEGGYIFGIVILQKHTLSVWKVSCCRMNRKLRTKCFHYKPQTCLRAKQERLKQKQFYDIKSKPLRPLDKNETARMREKNCWSKKAVVCKKLTDRSYKVKAEDGGVYVRNRIHLLPTKEKYEELPVTVDDESNSVMSPESKTQQVVNTPQKGTVVDKDPVVPRSQRQINKPQRLIEEF
ncbi:predicted protein [Nematostella vectensis]|uniref:Uncharacterized protein n=1 Tax=Nematostella vectensis TaxID=45351 RepID=A7RJ39_NEMVE|nr:predicted protein [Nematostella vectensis]|eukprot:XP_001640572.1 predicted protein [Nematostella vectensis]